MVETTEEYRTRINQLQSSILSEPYMKKMRPDIAEGIGKTGNRQADLEVKIEKRQLAIEVDQIRLQDGFSAAQQDARSTSPNGAELAVAAGKYGTLDARLNAKEKQLAQKTFFADTVAVMKTINYLKGDVIYTKGYYEANDGGAAEYHVTDTVLIDEGTFSHTLAGGLYAELVAVKEVHVNQLGAKPNYWGDDIDNFSIIQKAFDSNVPTIQFQGSGYYVRDAGKRLNTKRKVTLEGNGATLLASNGVFLDTNGSAKKVTARNLNVVSNNTHDGDQERVGVGIEMANLIAGVPAWGACVDFTNIRSEGFSVGVRGDCLFQAKMDNVAAPYCNISFDLISSPIFSNVNTFNQLTAMYAKYGIVMEDFRNAIFTNTTIENVDYGVVVDTESELTVFETNWFEYIHNAPVVFGKVVRESMTLKRSNKTNTSVTFKGNRYSLSEYQEGKEHSDLFFDKSTSFSSSYKKADKANSDYTELMTSGVAYKNLSPDTLAVTYQTGGVLTNTTKATPFGQKTVLTAAGVDLSKPFFVHCNYKDWIPSHVYLLKVRLRVSKPLSTMLTVPSSPAAFTDISNSTLVPAEAWTNVSSIVKMKETFSGIVLDDGGRFGFSFYGDPSGTADIDVIEPMIVDLTVIFGAGNEPDVGLNKEIGNHLTYVNQYVTSKTGNQSVDVSNKKRVTVSLQNGWTGSASYKYLGNGLTEISGYELGTGAIASAGVLLFTIPLDYAPIASSIQMALVTNIDPFNKMMTVIVKKDGKVMIQPFVGHEIAANSPLASVQFHFVIASNV